MANKTDRAVKDLAKEVKKLRKENEKLGKTLEKVRKDQARSHREILTLLQERVTTADAGADAAEYRGILDENGGPATTEEIGEVEAADASADAQQDHQQEPEVTDAAKRRAEELGVDPTGVKGTGSGGRVLVKDVEAAAS